MSTHDPNPTKRVPKSLGTDAKLFGTYTLTDAVVALLPGVLVILLAQFFLPTLSLLGVPLQSLVLPIAALAIALGALFVYLTPAYTSSLDWLITLVSFHRSTRSLNHDAAKTHTQIERFHPDTDTIERTDGTLVGLVHVTPPSMALATDAEWTQKARSFQDFLDTVVEFPIQLFSTTQPYPIEFVLEHYESRLEDPDVVANPRLACLIESYIEWYETDLTERRITIRDHYAIVSVSPNDVQFERETHLDLLARLPVLGIAIRATLAPRDEEQRAAAFALLDDRLRHVEGGLRDVEGCSASRVSTTDAADILATYWTGRTHPPAERIQTVRTRPIIASRADVEGRHD